MRLKTRPQHTPLPFLSLHHLKSPRKKNFTFQKHDNFLTSLPYLTRFFWKNDSPTLSKALSCFKTCALASCASDRATKATLWPSRNFSSSKATWLSRWHKISQNLGKEQQKYQIFSHWSLHFNVQLPNHTALSLCWPTRQPLHPASCMAWSLAWLRAAAASSRSALATAMAGNRSSFG